MESASGRNTKPISTSFGFYVNPSRTSFYGMPSSEYPGLVKVFILMKEKTREKPTDCLTLVCFECFLNQLFVCADRSPLRARNGSRHTRPPGTGARVAAEVGRAHAGSEGVRRATLSGTRTDAEHRREVHVHCT